MVIKDYLHSMECFSLKDFFNTDTSTTHYFKTKTKSTRTDSNDVLHQRLEPSMDSSFNANIDDKLKSSDKDKNISRISTGYRPLLTKSDSIHDLNCKSSIKSDI